MEYVYLVRKEIAAKEGAPVCKIGRTSGKPWNRVNTYGDCEIFFVWQVADSKAVERILKKEFRARFQSIKTFGNPQEDFAGDIEEMKKIFMNTVINSTSSTPST
ncbi:hypothetical protein BNJ_00334 [Kaumoebavirus]|uniref:hypothetical protein n=1 Tax=Kaumoebavirus TaxID=1859492 RepID=UPI0009C1C7B5|nr:hypothetical protein BNJ_00334 [Kaumoebavirus]ARA72154.1 hypothetical protein BNJ_00334 [Kaumoebavirus]